VRAFAHTFGILAPRGGFGVWWLSQKPAHQTRQLEQDSDLLQAKIRVGKATKREKRSE
jgi:hypothetical protein